MKLQREFYIPEGARKVADKRSDAVAYLYEREGPCAVLFVGKQAKPAWRYRFATEAQREAAIRRGFESRQATEAQKAEQKAKRDAPHKLQLGHILVASWGYDQTNIDFYQVTRVIGRHMVEIRPLRSTVTKETGWASGACVPVLDAFKGDPMVKRVSYGDSVKVGCARASIWDGRPENWTAYA